MKYSKFIFAVVSLLFFSSCQDPMTEVKNFLAGFGIQITMNNPQPTPPQELRSEMGSVTEPVKLTAGELAKENSELLAEMYNVVFDQKDSETKEDFGSLVHTLNQGASLEGIYRGLIMGSRYRALESKAQGASPTELKAFAIEMAELQDTMKNPSVFEADSKKAPSIEYPDGSDASASANVPDAHNGSQEVTKKKDKAAVRDELLETFLGASGFTLKRLLGDEALKKMDELKDDKGGLSQWYAEFVIRMAASKVDFGLALRSQPDFDFHFKFAQKMALDRVKWEVLNRYHRYLNFTATQSQ